MPRDVRRITTSAFSRGLPGASTQAVAVPPGRSLLFTTGVIARDAEGRIVGAGDIRAQTEQVFANLAALLAEAGATLTDIVSATIYLRSMDDLSVVREVRARHWATSPPVLTTVEVSRLVTGDVLIELTSVAVLPDAAD